MKSLANTASLRPARWAGNYPQKQDERLGLLDKLADNITGVVRQHVIPSARRDRRFLSRVLKYQQSYAEFSGNELREKTRELRSMLYCRGMQDTLIAQAFALIRVYAGITLGMQHHEVQLLGGLAMLRGKIVEMETGEGKTLTATLAGASAAMAGIPVHVITVNDYLATRDEAWMKPLYEALELTTGCVTESSTPEQRKAAYAAHITYCTNKQVAFDYLKDRLLLSRENRPLNMRIEALAGEAPRASRLMLRGLCFGIVDEADSILVDEARTPLVISSKGQIRQEEQTFQQALDLARKLGSKRDFTVDHSEHKVEYTDLGKARLRRLGRKAGGIWARDRFREETVKQALSALHLYQKNVHYLVRDSRVVIIDEFTGRTMSDRSWEKGLHQMIESKEGCSLSARQETLARISYQKFFRRYMLLAGMTGTASEAAGEFWQVYNLPVVRVPTHKPVKRRGYPVQVFRNSESKWDAVVDAVRLEHDAGRPVLVGTKTVEASEQLSGRLLAAGLKHTVLNANQHMEEASIIADAGQQGAITIATNMAGRGTDIRLSEQSKKAGGLHVILTEANEAARIDRQLFGRCGRQGDPGSWQLVVACDDDLFVNTIGKWLLGCVQSHSDKALPVWLGRILRRYAQRKMERRFYHLRKRMLSVDDTLSDMLAFSGYSE